MQNTMMDWYYDLESEDLVVPGDQEVLDGLTSPSSWSNWGMDGSESFGWIPSFDSSERKFSQQDDEELNKRLSIGKVKGGGSLQESDQSNASSISSGSGWSDNTASCQRDAAAVHCRPDLHFNDLTGCNKMDDIFLNSLLKDENDLPATDQSDNSFVFDSESHFNSYDSFTRQCTSSQRNAEQASTLGHYSMSEGHPSAEALGSKVLQQTNGICLSGRKRSDMSREESVLCELGLAINQVNMSMLPGNTRMCLRDSLYRLAHNSSQQMAKEQQNETLLVSNKTTRTRETETAKAESNTIDRAVANLMFNKVESNTKYAASDVPARGEYNYVAEGSQCSSFNMAEMSSLHHHQSPMFLDDPQVPVFALQNT